jgi:2-C-methyl-D-erythritol 4-phosphate cytidylyltransferase/2-C-methyl-D-erythritol 2,4-cyclodiphosphate synthase
MSLVRERGWQVNNVDITIIAQAPKLAPYRDAMRSRLAELLGVEIDAVSIKFTTTDQMGAVGRKEGIAAIAVVSVIRDEGNDET